MEGLLPRFLLCCPVLGLKSKEKMGIQSIPNPVPRTPDNTLRSCLWNVQQLLRDMSLVGLRKVHARRGLDCHLLLIAGCDSVLVSAVHALTPLAV